MGLYLCVFNEERNDELAASEIGSYADFGCFRDAVARHLDAETLPVLMLHSDCDGEWPVDDLESLLAELEAVRERFKELPAEQIANAFEHSVKHREGAEDLYGCFHDVYGVNLIDALMGLAKVGLKAGRPISFQ